MWPSTDLSRIAEDRLHAQDRDVAHLAYGGAGHLIGPPHLPNLTALQHSQIPMYMALGGSRDANGDASANSWAHVIDLFRRALG